eukprot:COSAG06_NODE_1931_length_8044_cov_5.197609_9_plen_243_part_00
MGAPPTTTSATSAPTPPSGLEEALAALARAQAIGDTAAILEIAGRLADLGARRPASVAAADDSTTVVNGGGAGAGTSTRNPASATALAVAKPTIPPTTETRRGELAAGGRPNPAATTPAAFTAAGDNEDVEDSPFSADLCVAALTRFRHLTTGLLTQLRQDTMQAMVGAITLVRKSRTIAKDEEKAHLQAEAFCTGLQTDVGDMFRSDLTETPVTSTRLQALVLISLVLAHTNSTRLDLCQY